MALDVTVLHKEPDVLTICKPPSVPVIQSLLAMRGSFNVVNFTPHSEESTQLCLTLVALLPTKVVGFFLLLIAIG